MVFKTPGSSYLCIQQAGKVAPVGHKDKLPMKMHTTGYILRRFSLSATFFVRAFFFWITMLLSFGVLAQNASVNTEKYHAYRERLLAEFMVSSPGNEPGTGIPASIRHAGRAQMRWGDATINLSNLLAVLATEYRRLKDQGAPYEETIQELHRALLAKERLDAGAPVFFGADPGAVLPDGFFIRDDIPASFTRDWSAHNPAFLAYPHVRSDYTDPDFRLNEMSQDQVWNLIIGLALVAYLVDDTTTWHIPDYHGWRSYTLSERAMLAGFRIISAMQDQACFNFFLFRDGQLCFRYWHLRNPYTGLSVKRGSVPNFLKYGFAEAGRVITGNTYGDMHWANSRYGRLWFNLAAIFQYLQRMLPGGHYEYMYHTATTATVGHVWSTTQLIRMFNRHRYRPFNPTRQYEHLALVSCVLHSDCPVMLQKEKGWYQHLLDTAPMHGPFNYGPDGQSVKNYGVEYPFQDEYHHEWSSVNRFVWPERRGTGTIEAHKGEYNGLDYMLLYNLFYLVYGID